MGVRQDPPPQVVTSTTIYETPEVLPKKAMVEMLLLK